MLTRIHASLSYANVMATVAFFAAFGGGAYAATALPANTIGTKQLKNRAVTPAKVAPSTIVLFKGTKGDTGGQGQQGIPGPQGVHGDTGPIGPSNAYFGSSFGTQASVSVPAGDYVVFAQGDFDNANPATETGQCTLASPEGPFGGTDSVTIASGESEEGSTQGVVHLSSEGSITSSCSAGVGTFVNSTIVAIKVGTASP
jgi:hypothetical protein